MAWVRLSAMPDPNPIQYLNFPALSGGLNLRDAEVSMNAGESPEMLNLWWQDGVLRSRPGQEYFTAPIVETYADGSGDAAADTAPVYGYAAADEPFHGSAVLHIGAGLYVLPPSDSTMTDEDGAVLLRQIAAGVPRNAGTFFRFGEFLYYKNNGGFYKISFDGDAFSAADMTEDAFVPTILINANPETGAGDIYQPENRLSAKKRVTYNASATAATYVRLGNGSRRAFNLASLTADEEAALYTAMTGEELDRLKGVNSIYIDGAFQEPALYAVDLATGVILFNAAPASGAVVTIEVKLGDLTYHLPVEDVDAVTEVAVDGLTMEPDADGETNDYSVDLAAGTVTFHTVPTITDPPTTNSVSITYAKVNEDALAAVMACPYAAVVGAGVQMCIVVGGGTGQGRQGNTVFWSGNNNLGLDASYWPISYYNLIGDSADPITGFGRQYSQLLVFQAHGVGKLSASIETVDGRNSISLTCERVNDHIGCGCPGSIRTVENNVVFCDADGGVFQVRSASAAYENNIRSISGKVNGSNVRPGLLNDLRTAGAAGVSSLDDGERYWLSVNGHVWVWDYAMSTAENPAWFFFDGFSPAAWFRAEQTTYLLNTAGRVVKLGDTLSDFGEGFRKVYQFPTQNFGSYDRLKDVLTVIISMDAAAASDTDAIYETDYETRTDRVALNVTGQDRLSNRDLSVRDLSVPRHAAVFRRRPMCRHVRHFSLRLTNSGAGEDMAVYSVQIQARFVGRDR